MGLGDFGPDDEDNSGSDREYKEITRGEMRRFLKDIDPSFFEEKQNPSKEMVMSNREVATHYPSIVLKVFTTIEQKTGVSRRKGADAIRTVLWDTKNGRPITGKKKTLRIKTWKKNLRPKIEELIEDADDYIKACSECNGWMVIRDGQYGKFYGCSNHPSCQNTENYEG